MVKKRKTSNLNITCQKLHLTNVREGKWNFSVLRLKLPMRNQSNIKHKNNKIPMKVVMIIKIKRSTNHMNKYMGSFKRLNQQCLMVRFKKEKRQNPSCQG